MKGTGYIEEHSSSSYFGIIDSAFTVGSTLVTSSELESQNQLSPGYIFRRTGVVDRFYSTENGSFLNLALDAVEKLIAKTNVPICDVSVLICASSTFDKNSPTLSCRILNKIDADCSNEDCFTVDINAACSGFIFGLSIAMEKLSFSKKKKKLGIVVTSEVFSSYLGHSLNSDIIFGDAATATLVEFSDNIQESWKVVLHDIQTGFARDKKDSIQVYTESGVNKMYMDGCFVFLNAVKTIKASISNVLDSNNLTSSDIGLYVIHQANSKIIDNISRGLNLDLDKFYINIDKYGNTGSSSIPLCLSEIFESNIPQNNRKIIISTFGAGFTYGTVFAELTI